MKFGGTWGFTSAWHFQSSNYTKNNATWHDESGLQWLALKTWGNIRMGMEQKGKNAITQYHSQGKRMRRLEFSKRKVLFRYLVHRVRVLLSSFQWDHGFLNVLAIWDGISKIGCGVKITPNLQRDITQWDLTQIFWNFAHDVLQYIITTCREQIFRFQPCCFTMTTPRFLREKFPF